MNFGEIIRANIGNEIRARKFGVGAEDKILLTIIEENFTLVRGHFIQSSTGAKPANGVNVIGEEGGGQPPPCLEVIRPNLKHSGKFENIRVKLKMSFF